MSHKENSPCKYFDDLMVCAVRYAITRRSHVSFEAENWIKAGAHLMHDANLQCMKRDIEKALRDHRTGYLMLDSMDVVVWEKMLVYVESIIKDRENSDG